VDVEQVGFGPRNGDRKRDVRTHKKRYQGVLNYKVFRFWRTGPGLGNEHVVGSGTR